MISSIRKEDLARFGNLELLAKQVVEGFITGLHKSPFHGFSVEFAEHRLYNTGESTRHIDWKLFARSENCSPKNTRKKPTCVVNWWSTLRQVCCIAGKTTCQNSNFRCFALLPLPNC